MKALTKALVSGGPLFPAVRESLTARGIQVRQCYATADAGLISYESGEEMGMIVDEEVIVEIVRPGTTEIVADGEVGEVVVTCLFSGKRPIIRLATGDLSAVLVGTSACGRTNMRLKGWLGRANQSAKVRGLFVTPAQVSNVLKRLKIDTRARLEIGRSENRDTMILKVEQGQPNAGLRGALVEAVKDEMGLRADAQIVALGSLVNDGKIIDDMRDFGN